MKLKQLTSNKYVVAAVGLGLSSVAQMAIYTASANAAFTNVQVRFDRVKISTPSTGMICATPASAGTVAKVDVTFPTGYTVSTTASNWAVSTTNNGWPTGAVAWPGIAQPSAAPSGQDVIFGSSTLTVGTLYCFNWTNSTAITTSATPSSSNIGTLTTQTSAPATVDQSTWATPTVASTPGDQIGVTATVPPSFSFALSANTDALGTLSSSTVSTSGSAITATVNTNAKNGWTVWANDTNAGLKSPSASNYNIGSTTPGTNSTLSAGTEGYNTGVTQTQTGGAGTVSVATPFVGGALGKGGGLDTSFRPLATSTGTANGAVLSMKNSVAISALTPAAADYADTITVVGAGLF